MSKVSMPNVLTVFVALTAGSAFASPAGSLFAQQVLDCPDVDDLTEGMDPALAHVRYLADDALEGRGAGTSGARCAAQYIADQFEAIGLEGAGPNGIYFQPFPIRAGAVLGAGSTLRTPQTTYTLTEDWIPFGYSASAAITGTLLYGGDGINRPQSRNNEYPTLDLTGRIVVVEDGDLTSPSSQALQTDAHFKATVAAGRNAGGMVILLGDGRMLPYLSGETRAALRIPVAAVRGEAADRIRQAARAGDQAFLAASVQPRAVEARNVAALLPGSDPSLADEVLIIGAHYDHLGFGGEGSLDPDAFGEVHNGADDNASGTSGLIEIARRLSESDRRPARSVLFLAFTAEEKGLWGSSHYVRNPLLPIAQTVAMLNMDMIGRLEGRTLTVMGVGTAEEWSDLLRAANQSMARPLSIATSPDGFGPSDHSSFYGGGTARPTLLLQHPRRLPPAFRRLGQGRHRGPRPDRRPCQRSGPRRGRSLRLGRPHRADACRTGPCRGPRARSVRHHKRRIWSIPRHHSGHGSGGRAPADGRPRGQSGRQTRASEGATSWWSSAVERWETSTPTPTRCKLMSPAMPSKSSSYATGSG